MVGTGKGVIFSVSFSFAFGAAVMVSLPFSTVSVVSTIAVSVTGLGMGVSFGAAVLCTASVNVADMYISRVLIKSIRATPPSYMLLPFQIIISNRGSDDNRCFV